MTSMRGSVCVAVNLKQTEMQQRGVERGWGVERGVGGGEGCGGWRGGMGGGSVLR